jgi:4-carboxymuconolactone decarboxylase
MSARIPPVVPGSRPDLADIEASIRAQRGRISLLYQILLNSPPIASGWERLLTAVRNESQLPAKWRELIILRVAVLNRAPYEFEAHIPHAQHAGMSDGQIGAVRDWRSRESLFDANERLLLELTDVMTREVEVCDELMGRLAALLDPRGVLEAVTTVAAYNMVSRVLCALKIGH